MRQVSSLGSSTKRAAQAGHVVQRIGYDDGGAAAEVEQGRLRSVHPATAGAARIATGATGCGPRCQAAAPGAVRCKRRDLLAQVLVLTLRAMVRLAAVEDDGFEAMAAVVATVFEDGHSETIIEMRNA